MNEWVAVNSELDSDSAMTYLLMCVFVDVCV